MLLVCDFETYYDRDFSLKKLTTEEYIRDSRFKVHGVGMKVNDQPSFYVWTEIPLFLKTIDWGNAFVCMHNSRFDAAILSWKYGIRPRFLLDTLSLSRAAFPHESGSLANLSKLCGLGEKGTDLINFMGKRDLTEEEQVQMASYCMNDVDLTYKLFQEMKAKFPPSELRIIDQTLRMFTEPVLELDDKVLFDHLQKIQVKQAKLLDGRDLTGLRSNPQFAKQLVALGVEPPTKVSARTGKVTFAFAKTDEGMSALLEHENEEVQLLAAARLGVKSSIEESRTKAFLGIAERGSMPVPLNYFGAQNTGRFCLTGETHITVLRKGSVYDILLLELRNDDLVWDGEEYVAHGGLVCNGAMEVMTYGGITGTPDHRVFCEETEDGEAVELREAHGRGLTLKVARRAPKNSYGVADSLEGYTRGQEPRSAPLPVWEDDPISPSGHISIGDNGMQVLYCPPAYDRFLEDDEGEGPPKTHGGTRYGGRRCGASARAVEATPDTLCLSEKSLHGGASRLRRQGD